MTKELIFGEKGDPSFGSKLMGLKEFQVFKSQPLKPIKDIVAFENHVERACGGFEKTIYQHLMQHFVNIHSSHITRSLLLYHFLGVGKSCSAITISEALLLDQTENAPPRIYIVAPSALHKNFEGELFSTLKFINKEDTTSLKSQCSGDVYNKLVYGVPKDDPQAFLNKLHKLIKSRYAFLTYADLKALETKGVVSDKIFIIDEAHNLRQNETTKASAESLKQILTTGINNRLVLLSATPMYNEPDEIFWLLSLMLRNEGRIKLAESVEKMHLFNNKTPDTQAFKVLAELSTEYISYIKGNNPFTFPARLNNNKLTYINEPWTHVMRDKIIQTQVGKRQHFNNLRDTDILNNEEARGVDELDNNIDGVIDENETNVTNANDATNANNAGDDLDEEDNIVKHKLASATQLQLSNITYSYKPGEKVYAGSKAFYEIFVKVDDSNPIQVKYRHGKANALMPISTNLGEIAPKINLIMDLIKSSEGIVVIYSQYVWSGIIPCAIALEHMGFNRHGTRKMLMTESKNINPVYYKNFKQPSYAILTGAESVMGNTKIEDILPILNNPKNSDGSNIKVILMTPIAGEGLSFKNAREIHILEPWYHFNRTEQVIGRTIRTCSHKLLAPEERNVTVYLHACVQNENVDESKKLKKTTKATKATKKAKQTEQKQTDQKTISPDIHAYKISSRKLYETQKAEEVIRDNAIDCALLENLNYYPKNIFQMSISMRTSQGDVISYTYGDDPSMQPKCAHPIPTLSDGTVRSDDKSMRSELFKQILPTTTLMIEKYILARINSNINTVNRDDYNQISNSMYYFTIDELVDVLKQFTDNEMIIYDTLLKCIYPNKLIHNWKLLPHLNGIVAIPLIKTKSSVIKMVRLRPNIAQKQQTIVEENEGAEENEGDEGDENDENKDQNKSVESKNVQIHKEYYVIANNILRQIPQHDPKDCIGIYNAYTMINSLNWRSFARYVVSLNNPSNEYKRVCELYAKTGAFVRASEIPRLSAKHKGRDYIGFIDIFDTTKLDVSLIDPLTDNFRDASEAELTLLKSKRRADLKPKTVETVHGILEPTHNKKAPAQLFTNQFKLIGTGAKGPISRGAVCDPKPASEIKKYLLTPPLNIVPPEEDNKNTLCFKLAIELMKHNLMFIYPEYKPK